MTQKLTMTFGSDQLKITQTNGKSARGFLYWAYDKPEKVIREAIASTPSGIPWFWLTMDSNTCLSTTGN